MSLVRLMRRTALFAYNLTALQNLYLRLQTTLYIPLFAPAIHAMAELFSYRFILQQLQEHIFSLR